MDNLNAVTSTALPAFSQLSEASIEGVSKLFRTFWKRSKPKPSSPLPEGLCRQFSLAEMKIATNNFNDKLLVGEGDFGSVYKGSIDDCTRIVKRLKLEDLRNEVVFVCQLHHPNLISLIGYCIDEGQGCLVYEFMVNGKLAQHILIWRTDHNPLPWKQRLAICIGIAHGLHYLQTGQKCTIIHNDVRMSEEGENWR